MGLLDLDALVDLDLKKIPSLSENDHPGHLFLTFFFGQAREFHEKHPFSSSDNHVNCNLNEAMLRRLAGKLRKVAETMETHATRMEQYQYSLEPDHAEAA